MESVGLIYQQWTERVPDCTTGEGTYEGYTTSRPGIKRREVACRLSIMMVDIGLLLEHDVITNIIIVIAVW
jgi:hypothetical protein